MRFKNPKDNTKFGSSVDEAFYWSARYPKCHLEQQVSPNWLFVKKNNNRHNLGVNHWSYKVLVTVPDKIGNVENEVTQIKMMNLIYWRWRKKDGTKSIAITITNTNTNTNNDQNGDNLSGESDPEIDIEFENKELKQHDEERNEQYYVK